MVRNDDPAGSAYYTDKTDEGGRFRIDGLVPGQSYSCTLLFRRVADTFPAHMFEKLVLRPGEVRDVGDVRIEPPGDGNSGTQPKK